MNKKILALQLSNRWECRHQRYCSVGGFRMRSNRRIWSRL